MAVIVCNGCFDLLHEGHKRFLHDAKLLGQECAFKVGFPTNKLVVAVNSDEYARQLKQAKHGILYPIDNLDTRMRKLNEYADQVISFSSEAALHQIIEFLMPCILVKGPDYANVPLDKITGADIAPVIILDTPEPESAKQLKREMYRK